MHQSHVTDSVNMQGVKVQRMYSIYTMHIIAWKIHNLSLNPSIGDIKCMKLIQTAHWVDPERQNGNWNVLIFIAGNWDFQEFLSWSCTYTKNNDDDA